MTTLEQLLPQLTLDEKVALLAGRDLWHSIPVPRLGIPVLKVSDGPNGVRGAYRDNRPPSICLPVGIALGATWNTALVEDAGRLLAGEAKRKNAHILLGPTVNIHRTPIAGRNFECFAEDPYLSGTIAAAYINGLQRSGVGACIKHFVCNDQEHERMSISAEVTERPLHEIYLEPFRLAMRLANPWSLMSGYNRINGRFASENNPLLKEILKETWSYDGLVISDWFGTYTPAVAAGGLDLEMPGPARWMTAENVHAALQSGQLTPAGLDDKVRRLLRTLDRVQAVTRPASGSEQGANLPHERQRIRQIAQETIVLLKNDQALPLDPTKVRTIAVIGQLARRPNIMGGGSSEVRTHYVVSPLDGLRQRAGDQVAVHYAPGCFIHRTLPTPDPATLTTPDGQPGLLLTLYDNLDFSGSPAYSEQTDLARFGWFEDSVPGVNQTRFCMRLEGHFTPQESGQHTLGLTSIGQSRLFLNGELLLDNWQDTRPHAQQTIQLTLPAGQPCPLTLEFRWVGNPHYREVALGHLPPHSDDLLGEALALARQADVAIVLAGLTNEWESEGFDRPGLALPGAQDELIAQVAAANPNTIVVLNAGSAVAMPWLDDVAAILMQWYNSQECGNALADILFGDTNPSGKLPTTFPQRLADNPAYLNYPGENGRVHYGEGLFVGYRYYDKKEITPLFPFGFGLSYTSFAYSDLQFSATPFTAATGLTVRCTVRNTGRVAGQEVVQLYVHDHHATLTRPEKELKAFAKVALAPGEATTVTFSLDQEAFWYYDPARGGWQAEPGEFDILIGASSRDIRLRGTVRLVGHPAGEAPLHTGLTLRTLLANDTGREILARHLSDIIPLLESYGLLDRTPDELAHIAPDLLPANLLPKINADFSAA
ncbi:MAG: glycoside hydrolase family 3 C-terminal domain-containing protein [Anaerolineales bacterium]|nr:glycoside hydrolase family 3 C-terminal domain-containing protein [Anaerolineales bacterium]